MLQAVREYVKSITDKKQGVHALPHYIKLIFSPSYHCLVVFIPKRSGVQIDSNDADQGKHSIKT